MQMPFLTIPIALPGDEAKDNKDKVVDCKIIPSTILFYHPGHSWGTMIYTSAGAIMSTLTMEEFETAWRAYSDEIIKQSQATLRKQAIANPFKKN